MLCCAASDKEQNNTGSIQCIHNFRKGNVLVGQKFHACFHESIIGNNNDVIFTQLNAHLFVLVSEFGEGELRVRCVATRVSPKQRHQTPSSVAGKGHLAEACHPVGEELCLC